MADKINTVDLSGGAVAILISVTRTIKIQTKHTKIQNPLSFHKMTNLVQNWQTVTKQRKH